MVDWNHIYGGRQGVSSIAKWITYLWLDSYCVYSVFALHLLLVLHLRRITFVFGTESNCRHSHINLHLQINSSTNKINNVYRYSYVFNLN